MDQDQSPQVFLDRRSYRQRRMMDALRLLPLVGLLLWMVPVLWPVAGTGDAAPIKLSQAVTYVFCVWLALIVATAGLWSRLNAVSTGDNAGDDNEVATHPDMTQSK